MGKGSILRLRDYHDLLTCASHASASSRRVGTSSQVSARLGHADITTTQRIYVHASLTRPTPQRRATRAKLAALYGNPAGNDSPQKERDGSTPGAPSNAPIFRGRAGKFEARRRACESERSPTEPLRCPGAMSLLGSRAARCIVTPGLLGVAHELVLRYACASSRIWRTGWRPSRPVIAWQGEACSVGAM